MYLEEEEEEEEEYEVQDILDKTVKNGKVLYYIKWKGFPLEDATWEPIDNLGNASKIIKNFEARNGTEAKKPTKSITGRTQKEPKEKKSTSSLLDRSKKIQKRSKESTREKKATGRKDKNEEKIKLIGDFDKDVPDKIYDHGILNERNGTMTDVENKTPFKSLFFCIEWKKRSDGNTPINAVLPFHLIKDKFPELLLDYISNLKYSD